ncbi:DUF1573 domain-containing protein [Aeoliella sp. SH292]|uniref:DUF1573 domain-containing protein n=1 Tax=Aeoliella sp. SH292 TaxID=3454464 RepID=UPI003F9DAB07
MRVLPVVVVSVLLGSVLGWWAAVRTVGEQHSAEDIAILRADSGAPMGFPKFEIDSREYNFGTMQRGTERKHSFVVSNRGTAPLSVAVVSTTCKCTAGEMKNNPIPPGESTELTLTWQAKTVPGTFRQTATLETSDPRARRVELTVEGQVTDVSAMEPKEWFFDKLRVGEGRKESIYVMSFQDEPLKIESAEPAPETTNTGYKVEVVEVAKDELPDPKAISGYRLDVTPPDSLPLGPLNDWIVLKTNIAGAEELRVPIMGTVVGDIEVRGPSQWNDVTGAIHFGDVQNGAGAEVKLFLNVSGEHAKDIEFEIEKLDPEFMEVELGERKLLRDDLAHVPLVVRIPKGAPPAIRNGSGQGDAGRIVLKTNHPTNPEISLDVRFVVKGAGVTK